MSAMLFCGELRPRRVFRSPVGEASGEFGEGAMYHFWLDACSLQVGARFLSFEILACHPLPSSQASIYTQRHSRTFFRKPEVGLRQRALHDQELPVWLKCWFEKHPQAHLECVLPAGLAALVKSGNWKRMCLPDEQPWEVGWRVLQSLWPHLDPCKELHWQSPSMPGTLRYSIDLVWPGLGRDIVCVGHRYRTWFQAVHLRMFVSLCLLG